MTIFTIILYTSLQFQDRWINSESELNQSHIIRTCFDCEINFHAINLIRTYLCIRTDFLSTSSKKDPLFSTAIQTRVLDAPVVVNSFLHEIVIMCYARSNSYSSCNFSNTSSGSTSSMNDDRWQMTFIPGIAFRSSSME